MKNRVLKEKKHVVVVNIEVIGREINDGESYSSIGMEHQVIKIIPINC
jgi:hypothetical protein